MRCFSGKLVRSLTFQVAQIRLIVIHQGSLGVATIRRFAAFTVVNINRHVFTGVAIQPAFFASASIYKNFM